MLKIQYLNHISCIRVTISRYMHDLPIEILIKIAEYLTKYRDFISFIHINKTFLIRLNDDEHSTFWYNKLFEDCEVDISFVDQALIENGITILDLYKKIYGLKFNQYKVFNLLPSDILRCAEQHTLTSFNYKHILTDNLCNIIELNEKNMRANNIPINSIKWTMFLFRLINIKITQSNNVPHFDAINTEIPISYYSQIKTIWIEDYRLFIESILCSNTLEELTLINCYIQDIPDLSKLPNLKRLNLSKNNIRSIIKKTLAKCNLEELNLSGNDLIRFIISKKYGKFLKKLDLSNNNINSFPILNMLSSLEVLNLNDNEISLLSRENLPERIHTLHISDNNLDPDDVHKFINSNKNITIYGRFQKLIDEQITYNFNIENNYMSKWNIY